MRAKWEKYAIDVIKSILPHSLLRDRELEGNEEWKDLVKWHRIYSYNKYTHNTHTVVVRHVSFFQWAFGGATCICRFHCSVEKIEYQCLMHCAYIPCEKTCMHLCVLSRLCVCACLVRMLYANSAEQTEAKFPRSSLFASWTVPILCALSIFFKSMLLL